MGKDEDICRICYETKDQHYDEQSNLVLQRRGTVNSGADRNTQLDVEGGPLLSRASTMAVNRTKSIGESLNN
jgi:hypothetical protein